MAVLLMKHSYNKPVKGRIIYCVFTVVDTGTRMSRAAPNEINLNKKRLYQKPAFH
jgi:hypothetical protein